jgi:hypothetical protein
MNGQLRCPLVFFTSRTYDLSRNGNERYRMDEAKKMYIRILPWVKANSTSEGVFIWLKP